MKLVPLFLLFCTLCSAKKKIKKIKRLLVAIGGVASLVTRGGGGIGKNLQLLLQRSALSGQQYANNYITQPLIITTAISPLVTSINPITVNTFQPQILSTTVVNQRADLHRKIAVPVAAPALPLLKSAFDAVVQPVAIAIDKQYAVPIPISIDQPIPLASIGLLDQTPILHQATVGLGLAQSPVLAGPLAQNGWAGLV